MLCLSARSRDTSGNLSGWSAERCTSTPLDDRGITASSGWRRATGRSYWAGTVSTIKAKGATVTRTGAQNRRISLLATTCPTCGSVVVVWNGKALKTLSLRTTTLKNKQLLNVVSFPSVRSGTRVIKTTSTATVQPDGVALSRD
jgi:hypothetical protein